jgi:outer membrane protein assembly factor BamE (lipoprotein component of BamABCDE complex)
VQPSGRWLIVAAAVVALLLVATGTTFVGMRERVGGLVGTRDGDATQSGAQISATEFESAHVGMAPETLRGLVGEPEATNTGRVEGFEIECWYYGVAGGLGAYQLCFANGKLRTKLSYGRSRQ